MCYHNTHLRFYVLNRDFPTEWFDYLNRYLNQIECHIYDIKVNCEEIKHYTTFEHIASDSTFFRYFIPQFLADEITLYLDCDVIVNGNLDMLYQVDLKDNFVGAVVDPINPAEFNAGVLLINNQRWKAENITQKAMAYHQTHSEQIKNGADQYVLNALFRPHWQPLHPYVNYQLGLDFVNQYQADLIEDIGEDIPLILHYNTAAKPWLPGYPMRFRHFYWHYHNLEWRSIIERHQPH
ncbi:glycosyltransferase family 8 protein [Muribacter muris]|uniref:glycosyltransferase family 8 protein n=1 Tax=Muribacter muris TaxID=67855 RepID=UPI002ADD7829|nr:glycosyltransferase family 8 protein [Muribacter muris]